ncbi:MAG TPA: riboflavin synthase [Proteobacteria bacterium]|nr:riboflavin synthase [bacterium BMS3Abin14]HDL52826.1 riboflavin synthase [Pseudomonadota bacterium]
MFTGIIEEKGKISGMDRVDGGARMEVRCSLVLGGTGPGDSIAVDGVCLTVEGRADDRFACFLSNETLKQTTFGSARIGKTVNLERALSFGGRIGGHLVAGHVEAKGRIQVLKRTGAAFDLEILFPQDFTPYALPKASVAVDGVSLTIVNRWKDRFSAAIIPETVEKTTLGLKSQGDSVNLEPDLILKYVRSAVSSVVKSESAPGLTLEKLLSSGFISE